MDIIEWLLNNGNVLDGTVLANVILLALIVQLFGIISYWMRRF